MKIFAIFSIMISCTVAANLLLKIGSSKIMPGITGFVQALFSLEIILGIVFFGISALLYLYALKSTRLSVAQSFASAQFVAVNCAAYIFLGEKIGQLQTIGMILILMGIFTVSIAAD